MFSCIFDLFYPDPGTILLTYFRPILIISGFRALYDVRGFISQGLTVSEFCSACVSNVVLSTKYRL